MPKKPSTKSTTTTSLADAGLQSFTTADIHRSDIKGAPYNPRRINDKERTKLKTALKKTGLVAPITWNKRSGHIVGGHQRMSIMDSLMKTTDYTLTVAVIDVDDAREKELNILLNNQHAQGAWDMEGLKAMFADEAVTLDGTGFDHSDLILMFGDAVFEDRSDDLHALAEKLADISSQYTGMQHANKKKATGEFYLVYVFPDSAHIDALIAQYGLPQNRYQNGRYLMKLLNVPAPKDDDE